MAEQSIRIADSTTGLRIAMTDAVELDTSGNARVMERVAFGSGKIESPLGNATRGNATAISAAETFDLTALPADLTGNLLVVGDKAMLVVMVEQTVSQGSVTITPIIFDNEGTPGVFGLLEPKIFTQPYPFRRGSGSGRYLLPVQRWDVSGAYKLGFHVSAISGTSNAVKIWARVV